ncbi:MAG: diaminopimelate decarboxylase [Candidatus Auribacterota bacterium]|nr:diaminopimelate decarboxylase [Candidatus Auribacterota bacterium]
MKLEINSKSWNYRDGTLYCEGVPLDLIGREVGTPVYVYSYQHLVDRFNEAREAWGQGDSLVCFSLKSNSSLGVAATLIDEGAGVDVVSGGELFRALKAGASPDTIVYAGVGKTSSEISEALRAGILFFTVESVPELHRINEIADEMGKVAPVSLRVTPDVDPQTHEYITTGKAENKFGLDPEVSLDFYRLCRDLPGINPIGIQMHIGSQILLTEPYREGVERLIEMVRQLNEEGIELEYLDIGGGMGVSYQGEEPPKIEDYAGTLSPLLKGLSLKIILEPGRFITANAGVLLTGVVYLKKKEKKNFIIIDAAMNDIIRPALYQAYHQIVPVSPRDNRDIKADVVGPICETGDTLGVSRHIPEPIAGDYLAIMSAGAYGYVMSSNYNSRPRPAEVMVKGDQYRVIRKRENYIDLIRGEKLPDFREEL